MIESISKSFDKLDGFLAKLEKAKIQYSLSRIRDGFILLELAIPGERWEIEFDSSGAVEVEKFLSDGEILGEEVLAEIFSEVDDAT